jgi:poly(beta-D-mannuronate) lyase
MVNNKKNFLQTPRPNGLGAISITFVNNIIQGGGPAAEISGPYSNPVWNGNIIFDTQQGDMPADGFKTVDPKLVKDGVGVFHLHKKSPAAKKGKSNPAITVDMDGQPRDSSPDIGADEISSEPVRARMLVATQVGCDALEI